MLQESTNRNKTNWVYLGIFLALIISLVIMTIYNRSIKQELDSQKTYYEQIHSRDSIKNNRVIREVEKKMFLYKDSLSNEKIKSIIQKNETANKKISNIRKSIPTASDVTKDSIWTASWNSKDTLLTR